MRKELKIKSNMPTQSAKPHFTIIPYAEKYRDDMLFCFLSAKDAVGKYAPDGIDPKPHLRDDMLDIQSNYFERGNAFYLAIDDNDRVVGMLGTKMTAATELKLKRLFIKPELKGCGIGSKLLTKVEEYALGKGVTTLHTDFAYWYREAARFYTAKGFTTADPLLDKEYCVHMVKKIGAIES
jgi:GNAT superfamily N-acetyltransferase